jgi:hypothetical protein
VRPLASVVLPAAQAEAVLADCRRFEASEEWCGPSESAGVENVVCLFDMSADSCRKHACKSSWFLLWWPHHIPTLQVTLCAHWAVRGHMGEECGCLCQSFRRWLACVGCLTPWGTRCRYAQHGIPYRRGFLLHGPPGTGKTSLVGCLDMYGI